MRSRSKWGARELWILAALGAASLYAHSAGWHDIYVQASRRADNGYIFLAPVVAGYLVWIRAPRLAFVPPRGSLWGPLLAIVSIGLALAGAELDLRVAVHGGAVVGLAACILTLAGPASIRHFAPAFLALLFLLPVPGEVRRWISAPLQDFATSVTHDLLLLLGSNAEREGNVIAINGVRVFVGEACDGMRMVFALALTVFAFVFSVPLRTPARIVLLLASPLIALLCNIARLVPTAIAYAHWSAEDARKVHDIAGWLMLPLAILLLLLVMRFMRWLDLPVLTWRFLQA